MQIMAGDRAAAYLSSYFVRGKSKATLQENARNSHLPRMLIWVAPNLTGMTGVTSGTCVAVVSSGRCGWGCFLRSRGQAQSSGRSCCVRGRGRHGDSEGERTLAQATVIPWKGRRYDALTRPRDPVAEQLDADHELP